MNVPRIHPAHLAVAVVASASLVTVAAPAQAKGDDVVRRGSCTASSDWKLKVGREDGRLEVEGEVDSNRNGQKWTWRIVHNGSVSAKGKRTTKAPSGSFEVRRLVVNLKGTDKITFRSRNTKNGEVCRGTVRF